jgi:hypothetical protein
MHSDQVTSVGHPQQVTMSACQETLSNHEIGNVQVRLPIFQQHLQLRVFDLLQGRPNRATQNFFLHKAMPKLAVAEVFNHRTLECETSG